MKKNLEIKRGLNYSPRNKAKVASKSNHVLGGEKVFFF